jgi:hypothetical protein
VWIEAEMPIRAARFGEVGVDGLMVEVKNFLAGIALVVGVDRFKQAGNNGR